MNEDEKETNNIIGKMNLYVVFESLVDHYTIKNIPNILDAYYYSKVEPITSFFIKTI